MTGREASIGVRLKIVAAQKEITFQYATMLYMHGGFLRRLSESVYRNRFILKGGLLLQCLSESSPRTTKDIDLLGRGIPSDIAQMKVTVSEICQTPAREAGSTPVGRYNNKPTKRAIACFQSLAHNRHNRTMPSNIDPRRLLQHLFHWIDTLSKLFNSHLHSLKYRLGNRRWKVVWKHRRHGFNRLGGFLYQLV